MKAFTDPFANSARAAGRGFAKVGKVLGVETNPHLALYKKLQPNDFTTIMDAYGPEATVQYIHAMEAKALTGRK